MSCATRDLVPTVGAILVSSALLFGQAGTTSPSQLLAPPTNSGSGVSSPFVYSHFYPNFSSQGWYGGFFSPFLEFPKLPPPLPYMPKYWWVGSYVEADPRQAGYNPSAGYPWDKVGTLLLTTIPAKTRITLDGVFVGTSEFLGPIQLPVGEHTLRVEAAGYEPSETVLKVEQPALQQLEVRLEPKRQSAKPAPRP